MDQRDLLVLDHSVDNMLESVDKALDQAKSHEEFMSMVESSVDQVIHQLQADSWVSVGTGWDRMAGGITPDLPYYERAKLIQLARLYYLKDPLIHQAASLITNYTFADGFRYSCNDEEWLKELDDWWNDDDNLMELTSVQAQEQKSIELIVDGEIFFVLFREPDGRIKVRTIPPEEITEVITHPDDYRRNLYYKRQYVPQSYNFQQGAWSTPPAQKTTYYADWKNYTPGQWGFEQGMPPLQEGVVFQIATNRIGRQKRGNTETYPALDWVKAHRQMLQDWVTIVKAYSTLAWKAKIKGDDARDLDRIKSKIAAMLPAYNATSGQLSQPAGTAGVQFENDLVNLSPMKTAGMATDPADSRQVRLMAGAGLGIMEHYFGDAGNANLATAQAMELPMLKKFSARQRFWEGVYLAIMTYVIIGGIENGRIQGEVDTNTNAEGMVVSKRLVKQNDDQKIVVQAPPILSKNLQEVAQGLVPLNEAELVPWEEAARYAMKALDIENVEEALVLLKQERIENEQKAQQEALDAFNRQQELATMKAKNIGGGGTPPTAPTPPTPPTPSGGNDSGN